MQQEVSSARYRWLSAVELLAGAALVVGHNVLGVLPNEVLILAALGLVSLRFRSGSWAKSGLGRPTSWRTVLLIAAAAAVIRLALGEVVEPLAEQVWSPVQAPQGADEITGNLPAALTALVLIWTFAALGEEIGYRGYLLRRAAELLGGSGAAWWLAVVVASVLFGIGHYYKGPAGMIDSGVAGLVLGSVYVLTGRNVWACVLAHGFIDTVAVSLVFVGVDF